MQIVNILGFAIAMFLIAVHFATKILDWYQRSQYLKYKDQSAEFISDLYKLKMKWAKRGEFMYCKALDTVIGAELMPEQDRLPQTAEGKDYIESMKKMMEETLAEDSRKASY